MADEEKKKGDQEEETARIDKASDGEGTARIQLTSEQKQKAGTARIDLKAARPKADTAGTARIELPDASEESTRISPAADTVEYSSEDRPAAPPVARPPEPKKSQTQRISLSAARPAQTAPTSREGLRNQTIRVQVEDVTKSETSKIATPKVTGEAGGTQRFNLAADPEQEDAFKRHSAPGTEEPAKAPLRTVKIKRKPPAPAPAVPTTTETAGDDADTVADAVADAPAAPAAESKSQTARIDLPPEAVSGRPKTIKIKRSAAAAPEKPEAAPAAPTTAPKKAKAPKKVKAARPAATGGPGPMYSVLAIAAVLIVCALIYMLLAQTFVPSLPFPGKLGV